MLENEGTAVTAIADLAQRAQAAEPRVISLRGEDFSTTKLHHVQPDKVPEPAMLVLSTLAGLAEFVKQNRDKLDRDELAVIISAPDEVTLVGPLHGHHAQRFAYLKVKPAGKASVQWGTYMDLESAVIALRSQFEASQDSEYLVGLLGNVISERSVQQEDDGFSQTVGVKAGVRLSSNVTLKPVVKLAPYRTFTEVAQPESDFLIRLQDHGTGIRVALFEADGGAWRREAISRVQRWLRGELGELGVPVIA